jgi:5S rRNA maturation endonuclease (ribonuclease M5)
MAVVTRGALPPGHFDAHGEYVIDVCPACSGKKKLYWNPRLLVGVCFGGGCGVRLHGWGDLADLYAGRLDELSFGAVNARREGSGNYNTLITGDPWEDDTSREFLQSRGITSTAVRAIPFGLRMKDKCLTTIIDPLSPEYSKEVYVRNHDGSGKWLPSRNGVERKNYAFGWKAAKKQHGQREVIILEGIMDLLALQLMGRSVAILGTDFPEPLAVQMRTEHMTACLFFDPDSAGDKARDKGMKSLKGWGVPVRIIEASKDPKDYTPEEVLEMVDR